MTDSSKLKELKLLHESKTLLDSAIETYKENYKTFYGKECLSVDPRFAVLLAGTSTLEANIKDFRLTCLTAGINHGIAAREFDGMNALQILDHILKVQNVDLLLDYILLPKSN